MAGDTQPGGKVNQVLSDAELTACVPQPPRWAVLESESGIPCRIVANIFEYGRAVEAAVLAKVPQRPKPIYEMHPADATNEAKRVLEDAGYVVVLRTTACREAVPNAFGCALPGTKYVTEREARTRVLMGQREGWDACIRELNAHCTSGPDQKWWNRADFQRGRDIRYPLPTKRVPRTVVLSDGTKVSRLDGAFRWKIDRGENGGHANTGDVPYCTAKTPADARLLADLVERPYDEVPDVREG